MKRGSLILLNVTLALTILSAGCSTGAPEEKPASDAPSASSKPSQTIRLFTDNVQSWPYREDWPVWRWIKEQTNITVKTEIPTGNFKETLALNVAANDLQDVIYVPDITFAQKYGTEGAFLDLSKYLDKMPNVKDFFARNPRIKTRTTSPNGELFYINLDGAGITNQMIWFYREDIFKKHQLQPPKTWDELYEVCKQLKKLYPDSYPFLFRHGLANLQNFGPGFNTHPLMFPDPSTGKVRYGAIEDQFKQLVTYLNKFYAEGLFPPDWLTMDAKVWTQLMVTNKSFITIQYIGQKEIVNKQLGSGWLEFMPPPAGPGGKQLNTDTNVEAAGFAVHAKTKNLDAALKFIDFLFSKEGKDIMSWGKVNETYTVKDGKRVFNPNFTQFTDLRKNVGILTPGTYGEFDPNALLSTIDQRERYAYEEAPKYVFPVQVLPPNFTADELEQHNMIYEPMSKYYNENIAKFIIGQRPLSEWSQYVDEMKKRGADKSMQMHQIAWDRQKKK